VAQRYNVEGVGSRRKCTVQICNARRTKRKKNVESRKETCLMFRTQIAHDRNNLAQNAPRLRRASSIALFTNVSGAAIRHTRDALQRECDRNGTQATG